jgi:hypothetical protein
MRTYRTPYSGAYTLFPTSSDGLGHGSDSDRPAPAQGPGRPGPNGGAGIISPAARGPGYGLTATARSKAREERARRAEFRARSSAAGRSESLPRSPASSPSRSPASAALSGTARRILLSLFSLSPRLSSAGSAWAGAERGKAGSISWNGRTVPFQGIIQLFQGHAQPLCAKRNVTADDAI